MATDGLAYPDPETTERGDEGDGVLRRQAPSFFSKVSLAGYIYSVKGFLTPMLWLRDWREYFYPPDGQPNIIKTYECRPDLPIRIFFPQSYDQTSPHTLPTLFTIHSGGFCLGSSRDDDEWNRAFADKHDILVIALNYSKAPASPFPIGLHDVEALLLAALADESLPIDRTTPRLYSRPGLGRTAILGFSAGGNLAMSVSQLPDVKSHPNTPAAAISIYGCLDLSVPAEEKIKNRPWKGSLPAPRGNLTDSLVGLVPAFDWSYIPYGHDLRDPLLSPHFAERDNLPPYTCLVAAELDMLAHESWRMACRLAGKQVPDRESDDPTWRICGNEYISAKKGELLLGMEDERFAFEKNWEDDDNEGRSGGGGVKWLLVPDALHGFDSPHIRRVMGGEETIDDAEVKTKLVTDELARWLTERVWRS
ncbi:Alpha/Beta hydrolase protein [Podospora australis]|uniref:Alpha/Beta hydrolase protein n=1 Tax=Podospora australis TaxID=1536484 RepID=A0AAN6WQ22_9PEZI|nr:Alpha/Beta hydrolase protein [Podospora australis]